MGPRVTKRQVRGCIFRLRGVLKQYMGESGTQDIQKELMILRNLPQQVFTELENEAGERL